MNPVDPDLAVLERLVGDTTSFASEHWGRRPLVRASGTSFDDLLTVPQIEQLLLSASRRPMFRLVRDGTTLPPERSTRPIRIGGRLVDDVADLPRIARAIDEGATLVLQSLQRTWEPLARFSRSLERAVSHPVQVNAYLSPAGSAGLGPHGDDHDVLALQVHGSKTWSVDGLGTVVAGPGDVLYVPAGTRHEAKALTDASLHLTVGILRITLAQAVQRAVRRDPLLEAPLPLGFARPENAELTSAALGQALTRAVTWLGDTDPDALAGAERERARSRRSPRPDGHLASVLAIPDLELGTLVERTPDLVVALRSDHDQRTLVLPDRRITMPTEMGPAVELLLGAAPVAIGDLPGLDDPSRLVLVRRLIRELVVRVCPPVPAHPTVEADDRP